MNRLSISILLGATLLGLVACKPDGPVMPNEPPTPLDGRKQFVGVYDVYDTLSNWLYEMEISLHPGVPIDSLFISGWGGEFDVYSQHHKNDHSNFLNFVGGFGIEDYLGNRWALYPQYDSAFMYNRLVNDTLRVSYEKSNIAFYVSDGVSFFSQSYREFAVKREFE